MEIGILLTLIASLLWSTNDIFNKKCILEGIDENFVLWIRFPVSTLLTLPLGIYFWEPSYKLLLSTLFWLPLEIAGSLFFIKSLKYSPISEVIPFLSFIPVFSTLGGMLILKEHITLEGTLGIFLIILGSFIITGGSPKIFLSSKKGIIMMILSALCFGLNIPIGKFAIVNSNPFFFTWFYCIVMTVGLLPFINRRELLNIKNYKNPYIIPIGFLFTLGGLFYNTALNVYPSPYVSAVERISIIFSVIYGKIFFKEDIKKSFFASIFMIFGVILISIGNKTN